ncbi:hypothetical protein EZV62_026156 [Acer yangbiense]|uniref:PGG domain-containing protein n=1 Tax=Acer yangbiense TaxID=1000413 RepID=A0A5C7GRC7_9ROSI|nr:hypothetical protein EZV62_026156 [Acer yangbiense]
MEASSRLTKEIYDAVLIKDWEAMKKQISKVNDVSKFLQPISMHGDNIIHLAVHSKKLEPLQQILDIVDNNEQCHSLTSSVNAYGTTVLHEAAICRNYEAVKLLVKKNKELIDMKSDSGETPLFRAAAYGNTKIVRYLISQPGQRVLSFERKVQLKGTALELLELDKELAGFDDKNGSSLYMLAKIPSVFKSRHQMGIWKWLFYHCLPAVSGHDDNIEKIKEEDDEDEDIESGLQRNRPAGSDQEKEVENGRSGLVYKGMNIIRLSVAKKLWKEKRDYELATKVAKILIKHDKSFNQNYMKSVNEDRLPEETKEPGKYPLFTAVINGNVELVKLILEEYPQAHEQINHEKQNILHVAAMHREKEIFDLVKKREVPMVRLARQTDVYGNTVLHSVADTQHYKGGAPSGPAYQLLEELEWFKMPGFCVNQGLALALFLLLRVEDIMPSYYTMLPNNNNMTAREVLEEKHKSQLQEAQRWIKDTSQSCSTVAVLVSTLVFAAAFTVPGGTNGNNGRPFFINSPLFLFFTISDILSLSFSLTAVVMFLAILTSPLDLDNFLDAVPRKLTLGFALLFMSVATTMLAFASTIFLVIRLDERPRWTTTLICCASFFPVGVLALTHFPLFSSFIKPFKYLYEHFINWTARRGDRNLVARFLRFPQSKDKVDT